MFRPTLRTSLLIVFVFVFVFASACAPPSGLLPATAPGTGSGARPATAPAADHPTRLWQDAAIFE
ncbi:MAG: hypothetical protein M3024_07630, partial [Candidatus Dormibacteraeota bacterium]|nr:hypothetical protein [Candidatus Dormibacteraeota bacterium]